MKKILAFNGSPRPGSNTSYLLEHFLDGASQESENMEVIRPHALNLEHCHGCLRCNVLRRCSISGDDWEQISGRILEADVLVFASPIYFHHLPGPVKILLDRFRSFNHVQITESGLKHTPWKEWKKDFVLLLCMGSPDDSDAQPVVDLFSYVTSILGSGNRLHVIKATRLAMAKQVMKTEDELRTLYEKLKLPPDLASQDHERNMRVLEACKRLGAELSADRP
jgi:putative NADPH-quinone reductase